MKNKNVKVYKSDVLAIFDKGIFWHDYTDDIEGEFNIAVKYPIVKQRIAFKILIDSEFPQLKESFDVLFFDWGGMSLGNSMLESFCDNIIEDAQNHTSRYYVMVSMMTSDAMRDALEHLKQTKQKLPFNVFLSIGEFASFIKQHKHIFNTKNL